MIQSASAGSLLNAIITQTQSEQSRVASNMENLPHSCQNRTNKSQLWEIQIQLRCELWALTLSNPSRYYEKSVIEQEIEELRGRRQANWIETKQSIREARYRLSLKGNESLTTKEYSTFFSDEVPNGRIPKTETVSTAMYGSLPRDDLLLEPLPPWFYQPSTFLPLFISFF